MAYRCFLHLNNDYFWSLREMVIGFKHAGMLKSQQADIITRMVR